MYMYMYMYTHGAMYMYMYMYMCMCTHMYMELNHSNKSLIIDVYVHVYGAIIIDVYNVLCKYRKVRPLSVGDLFQTPPGSGAHLSHEISHVIGTASQVGLQ